MTIYKVTVADIVEPYFVDAETSDQAIDEVKELLGLEQLSGDVEEMIQ